MHSTDAVQMKNGAHKGLAFRIYDQQRSKSFRKSDDAYDKLFLLVCLAGLRC